jgi:fatty-acyl-CoA synthase
MASLLGRIGRDVQGLALVARTLARTRGIRPEGAYTVPDALERQAARRPRQIALRGEDTALSYRDLDRQANRVARWARQQGIGRGEVVALLMGNRPEFCVTWLGLAKVGAVTALLNTQLRGQALAHCLRVAGARHLVLGAELADALASAHEHLEKPPVSWALGGPVQGAADLAEVLGNLSPRPLDPGVRKGLRAGDELFYIYTSGTTGLPKAARFSHYRFLLLTAAAAVATRLEAEDCMYVPLPLYHTAGGVMAVGSALVTGASAAIAPRFSASRFWSDCVRHEATVFQYIGELCRYLLHSPRHADERRHRVTRCIGNGLRPDIWEAFQERFAIPRVIEFYGATEGNVALVNVDGKLGSVGRLSGLARRALGIHLLRFDVEREEVVRGPDGFCIACEPGEVGEAVGRISAIGRFEGYTNAAETEKKILRDVFRRGDAYFRTGDLLRMDADGYFGFVDRIGDTFRFKGENVATSEVAELLSVCPGVREAVVYGVRVPGVDGRAGMAALVVEEGFEPEALGRRVAEALPSYARPRFLRLRKELDVTGTFKHRKVELVREGFDPAGVGDPLFFLDPEQGYVPLDAVLYARITSGEVRP